MGRTRRRQESWLRLPLPHLQEGCFCCIALPLSRTRAGPSSLGIYLSKGENKTQWLFLFAFQGEEVERLGVGWRKVGVSI